jgi:hypothetical protein
VCGLRVRDFRSSPRWLDSGVDASVGSVGDGYCNALAASARHKRRFRAPSSYFFAHYDGVRLDEKVNARHRTVGLVGQFCDDALWARDAVQIRAAERLCRTMVLVGVAVSLAGERAE